MNLEEIGETIRRLRTDRQLTQAQLASAVHLTRTTLSQLENGNIADLGIRKVQAVLLHLGLSLGIEDPQQSRNTNYLRLAATTASVSFKTTLEERTLLRALLTGKIPSDQRPHLRALLEEAPPVLLRGLTQQVGSWTRPGKVEKNLDKIAAAVGLPEMSAKWLTKD